MWVKWPALYGTKQENIPTHGTAKTNQVILIKTSNLAHIITTQLTGVIRVKRTLKTHERDFHLFLFTSGNYFLTYS